MTGLLFGGGRAALLISSFLAFVVIGAEQALYGPAFEAFRERFGQDASGVSLTVSLHFLGAFITIFSSGLLVRSFGYRTVLTASAVLMALGLALVGLAWSWLLVLAGSFAAGLGFGALDAAVNMLVVRSYADAPGPALNLLNASFGVGAIAAPLIVAGFAPSVDRAFLLLALASVLVALLLARVAEPPIEAAPAHGSRVSLLTASGFVLVYFLYVSAEVGIASWEPTHLAPHFGSVKAASFTSLYWMAITVGRVIAAPLSARLAPGPLVVGCVAAALLAASLTWYLPAAPFAYALIGLFFAPIFPGTLAWLNETFPRRSEQLAPLALAGASLGPVATAPLIGLTVEAGGPAAVPFAITSLLALLLLVAVLLLMRRGGGAAA